jgi:hypothetical protein
MNKKRQIIIFVAICLVGISYAIYQRNQLETNYLISIGEIKDVEYTSKSTDYFVSYSFPEKEGINKSPISYRKFRDIVFLKVLLKDKKLSVIYQKGKPENNRMLFLHKDYKKYSIVPSIEQERIIESIDSLLQSKQ